MANGTYAKNMEIEMLKKELMEENQRLERVRRGERISPVIFVLNTLFSLELASGPQFNDR